MHDLVKVDRMMIDSEHQKYYAVFRSNRFTNMKYSSVLAYWLKEEGYVRRQSFSEWRGVFVTEALVRFLFEFMRQRLGAASGVFGLSVS